MVFQIADFTRQIHWSDKGTGHKLIARWSHFFGDYIMKKNELKQTATESTDACDSDATGLEEMQVEELSGSKENDSLEVSDTDDDEDEGVGDGTMGRTMDDPLRE
jgi:hypothetical protein